MKTISSYITLHEMHCYAYHGVAPQETKVGNDYVIYLRIKTDLSQAGASDEVEETINYAHLVDAIKQEMAIPSKLLEHVSRRLISALFEQFPTIEAIDLKLQKRNPPMGADIESAGIEWYCER